MALTELQQVFLDTYLESLPEPYAYVAESLGISRNTAYGWRYKNINGFRDELEARQRAAWDEAREAASETMFSLMRSGDFKAAKYILDYHGYAPTQRIQAEVSNDIVIEIGTDDNKTEDKPESV